MEPGSRLPPAGTKNCGSGTDSRGRSTTRSSSPSWWCGREYTLAYRGHIRIKDDKDVTAGDFAKYHVVLFGDPGSNRWIAKLNGKLPLHWTRGTVALGSRT